MIADELFFIDVGPIVDEHEADLGRSFILNKNSKIEVGDPLIAATRLVWDQTAKAWFEFQLSGRALYEIASVSARNAGYELNRSMGGHRLGDFPHAVHSKIDLADIDFVPSENLWVLEIHLLDRLRNRGAFFEDLLRPVLDKL